MEEQPAPLVIITVQLQMEVLCLHKGWEERYPSQNCHWWHWEASGHQDRLSGLMPLKHKA